MHRFILRNIEEKRVVAMLPEFLADSLTSTRTAAIAALERRHNKKDLKLIKRVLDAETTPAMQARLVALRDSFAAKKHAAK